MVYLPKQLHRITVYLHIKGKLFLHNALVIFPQMIKTTKLAIARSQLRCLYIANTIVTLSIFYSTAIFLKAASMTVITP